MHQRILVIFSLLLLSLATVTPALADKPDGVGRGHGKPPWAGAGAQGKGLGLGLQHAPGLQKAPGLQNVPGPKMKRSLRAVIRAINGTVWDVDLVSDEDDTADVKVEVKDAAVKAPARLLSAVGDFRVGDHVVIKLARQQPTDENAPRVASRVHLVPARIFDHVTGEIVATSGSPVTSIRVRRASDGTEVDFNVNDATNIRRGRHELDRGVLTTGTRVTVVIRVGSADALAISVHGPEDDD